MDDVILSVKDLCVKFKTGNSELFAVDNVSFDIKKGEVFGLVGESGCGKTTLGRTIMKIYQPDSGEVYLCDKLICGKNLPKQERLRVCRNIQMVFQDPLSSLNPRMTIEEIVCEGLIIGGEKDKRVLREKCAEMLSLVGLSSDHMSRYPHEFSGGQRQRIGIARALVVNPKLLIADEPVSALDVSVQAQVINLLESLKKNLGLTLLFIAHDLSVVKYFSDRIAVMYKGKIIELADSDRLFENPLHPYTRALLSAIPRPDPVFERQRKRISYTPHPSHFEGDLGEIETGHFLLGKFEV